MSANPAKKPYTRGITSPRTTFSNRKCRPEAELIEALKSWMNTHKAEGNLLNQFAQKKPKLIKVSRIYESNTAGIRQNLFKLRDIRNQQKQLPELPKP